jgi:hypothetical protein
VQAWSDRGWALTSPPPDAACRVTRSYVELLPREMKSVKEGGKPVEFVDVAAGLNYSAAISKDGKVGALEDTP